MPGSLDLDLVPVNLSHQMLPTCHKIGGMVTVDHGWPPVCAGVDVELHEEALGGVVSTEESIEHAGVETLDDENPSLHLGSLPGGTGD